jgi:hypothetical protein
MYRGSGQLLRGRNRVNRKGNGLTPSSESRLSELECALPGMDLPGSAFCVLHLAVVFSHGEMGEWLKPTVC